MPAFQVKAFSFLKSTGAATVTQLVRGLPFRPQAILLFTAGQIQEGAWSGDLRISSGLAVGTAAGSVFSSGHYSQDAVATSVAAQRQTAKALSIIQATGTAVAECDLAAFLEDGIALSWTTNNAVAYMIYGIALAGLDGLAHLRETAGGLGSQQITGAGFRPDAGFFFSNTVNVNPASPASTFLDFIMGMVAQLGNNIGVGCRANTAANPSNTKRQFNTGSFIILAPASAAEPFNIRTLHEYEADGYADRGVISGGTSMSIGSLLMKLGSGQVVQSGMFMKSSGVGPVRQTLPLNMNPKLIVFLSDMATQSRLGSNHARAMVGVATRELQYVLAINDTNGISPTVSKSIVKSGIAIIKADNNPPVNEAEGQVQNFRPGAIDILWSPNDSVALPLGFMAFGDQLVTTQPPPRTRLVRQGVTLVGG